MSYLDRKKIYDCSNSNESSTDVSDSIEFQTNLLKYIDKMDLADINHALCTNDLSEWEREKEGKMNNTNKKVVISQPMNSLRLEVILKNREKAVEFFDFNGIEVIDTVFDGSIMSDDYIHESLYYLARVIDAIGKADAVYFMPGWEEARGCVIEHDICKQYNVPIFYELPSNIEFHNKIYSKIDNGRMFDENLDGLIKGIINEDD